MKRLLPLVVLACTACATSTAPSDEGEVNGYPVYRTGSNLPVSRDSTSNVKTADPDTLQRSIIRNTQPPGGGK